jgi:hypothetical protein
MPHGKPNSFIWTDPLTIAFSSKIISQILGRKACVAEPQDILSALRHCIGNVLNSLVFGVVYKENDPTWKWLQDLQEIGTKHIGIAGPVNFMPVLRSVYLLTLSRRTTYKDVAQ